MEEIIPTERPLRTFTRTIRGYQPSEVDSYIDRITENYAALYRENVDLVRRLSKAQEKLAILEAQERSAGEALERARKESDAIINDAYRRADEILASVKTNCDAVLRNFREKAETQRAALSQMRESATRLKDELYESYRKHIELIESLPIEPATPQEPTPDEYIAKVVAQMKREIAAQYDLTPETISVPDSIRKAGGGACLSTQKESFVFPSDSQPSGQEKAKRKKESVPSAISLLDGDGSHPAQ